MNFVITLTSNPLTYELHPELVDRVEQLLFSKGVTFCSNKWLAPGMAVEINFCGLPRDVAFDAVKLLLERIPIDKNIQENANRRKKMLIADMDSTILEIETLDEIGRAIGKANEISVITEKAMNGEIDFETALKRRVRLLAGLHIDDMVGLVLERLAVAQGAQTQVKTMKAYGAATALVSGGFTVITELIREHLNFDISFGNTLATNISIITGELEPPVIDAKAKAVILENEREKLKISRNEILAVGDGANDIPMLEIAGLGVGFRPKPVVKAHTSNIIVHFDLTGLLFLQGYSDTEFVS